MIATYDVGDVARLGTASDIPFSVNGTPTDPTAVELHVIAPGGLVTVYHWPTGAPALTRDSAGAFHADHQIDEAGTWQYNIRGTGAAQAAASGELYARSLAG